MDDNTQQQQPSKKRDCASSRACSRRVRRLFRWKSTSRDDQEPADEEVEKKEEEEVKKPKRPLNSYLKVVLDDDTMDRLHGMAVKLQNDIRAMSNQSATAEEAVLESEPAGATATTMAIENVSKQSPSVEGVGPGSEPATIQDASNQSSTTVEETGAASSEPVAATEAEETIQNTSNQWSNDVETGIESELAVTTSQNASNQSSNSDPVAAVEETKKKSKRKRSFKFRPRSRTSLHLTFFFGGEVLCALPEEELVEWHNNVKARLERSNFVLNSDPTPENEITKQEEPQPEVDFRDEDYWFRIKGLWLFPPRRNYLIVAKLEASPAWHALHDDIRDIAVNGESEALHNITRRSKGQWTPHVTLGNLYGGRKSDLNSVRKMLRDFSFNGEPAEYVDEELPTVDNPESDEASDRVHAVRISMGGPVPSQVELDWDFIAPVGDPLY